MNSRQTRFDSLRIFFRQLITNTNHIIHQLFNNNEQETSQQSTQPSIAKFTVMQFPLITILGYLLMLVICIVGVEYVLNVPSQRQLSAIDLVADNGVTIRNIEKNNQGVAFRWLSDQVSLTIPQPTRAGILILDYWIAPQRVATTLLVNSTTFPLPPTAALIQRRIAILVFHADGMPQTNIALKFSTVSQKSIAWAFTSATWQSITPIFHYLIWIGLGVIALLVGLSLQRIFQRHWLSMAGTSLIVVTITAIQPTIITTMMALINNPNFFRTSTFFLIGWIFWYWFHPQLMRLLYQHNLVFLTDNEQMTLPGSPQQSVTEFTVAHFFSIMVAACTLFIYPIALYRADTSEFADQYLTIAIVCISALTFMLLHFSPQLFQQIRTHNGTKITLLLLIGLFFGLGFREDVFITEFLGFGPIILVCLLILVYISNISLSESASHILQLLMKTLSIFVLIMGLGAALISVNLVHNLYIINEMVTPLTSLKPYSTFIPQYVNLYQYFPQILATVGVTQYPHVTVQIIYLFLQFMSLITIGIAVFLNYYFMPRRSIFVAILFTLPFFFISTQPFWDYKTQYFVLHLFSYSLISVRLFTVLGVGSICIWLLRNANDTVFRMLLYGLGCGLIASIGIYQSNDFGLFAAVGVGAAIVFQPFQTWQKRIGLATIFVVSVIIGCVVLLVLNTDLTTLNSSYLFWFQRTFASGLGSLPIQFPGNGLMIIISIITLWFCTLKVFLILRKYASIYAKDRLISSHFALLMFIITTTVLSMSYYINRSAISFQGSSMYIGLGLSVFLLYQLIIRMTVHQPQHLFSSYSNIAFKLLVLLPVAIALVYTPLFSRLDQNSIIIHQIITKSPNDIANTPEYQELQIKQVQDIYAALQPLKMKVAFAGGFANLVELYTNIPTVNAFDDPSINISKTALNIYCTQINQMPYDIVFVNSIKRPYKCDDMLLLVSQKIDGKVYLRRNFATNYPQQWSQINEILCPNEGFRWNSTTDEKIRSCYKIQKP